LPWLARPEQALGDCVLGGLNSLLAKARDLHLSLSRFDRRGIGLQLRRCLVDIGLRGRARINGAR
jgi:hypothetical protein